ncbi:MAG: hypothetical protein ACQESR_28610 [Planctomycetota bacterium]
MEPSTHHIIHIDGHRIAYDQNGEGRSVVLIHGIPTSRLLWRKVMTKLLVNGNAGLNQIVW